MATLLQGRRLPGPSRASLSVAVGAAAVLSLVAAAIHLVTTASHFEEWWAYGFFFLATALCQIALRLLVLTRSSTWLLLSGIAGNAAVVGMYVLSRTNGPPLGPHAGRPEATGAIDLICTVAEVGAIAALVCLLPPAVARRTTTVLGVAGAALWTLRFTGVLL